MSNPNDPGLDAQPSAVERHDTRVTTLESDGEVTRGAAVQSVVEKATFDRETDDPDDMPLPTDPRSVFLGGLFGLAVLTAMYVAAEIVLPFVLAVVLKLLLQPLVRLLERARIPRGIGALVAILLLVGAFAGTISLLASPAASWAAKLPDAVPKVRDSFSFLKQPFDAVQHMLAQVESFVGGSGGGSGSALKPSGVVGAVVGSTAAATSTFLTTLLILFYLLVAGETFLRRMVEILPRFKDKRNAVELSFHIERDVSAYLLTITCINFAVGVAAGVDMWFCGVDSPPLWGAVAFLLNFIPILGPMAGIVIFLMASVLSLGVTWWTLLPAGIYLGIHILEGELFTPTLLARRFTINPVAVILALTFWFWMWGVAGAILAFPMLAITKIICDDLRPLRAIGHLLEG